MGTDGGMPLSSADLLDGVVGDCEVDFPRCFTCVLRGEAELAEQALSHPVVALVLDQSTPASWG